MTKETQAETKRRKLIALRTMMDLETGELHESAFPEVRDLYTRAIMKKTLDREIRNCKQCPAMNIKRITESSPGRGDLFAKVFFVGQSLHEPGMCSHVPFILGSGYLIEAALRLSGIPRHDIFWTNAVHCHPQKNRASKDSEKSNCLPYLIRELGIVQPRLVVTFGNDAESALAQIPGPWKRLHLKHPAALYRNGSAEAKVAWVLRLSKTLDKYSRSAKGG